MQKIESRWILLAIFSLLGMLIALYLSLSQIGNNALFCPISGCEKVQSSVYSKFLGIPVAAYGLLAFTVLLSLSLFGAFKPQNKAVPKTIFFFSSLGIAAYATLTYFEAFVIHAWCFWCVTSSLMMLGIWLIAMRLVVAKPVTCPQESQVSSRPG